MRPPAASRPECKEHLGSIAVTPHLNFRGKARQALKFYQSVFGGDLTVIS